MVRFHNDHIYRDANSFSPRSTSPPMWEQLPTPSVLSSLLRQEKQHPAQGVVGFGETAYLAELTGYILDDAVEPGHRIRLWRLWRSASVA